VEVVWSFEYRTFCIGSWRAKLILAPLGMPKQVWPSMNRYRMFYVQTSTLPPRMNQKLTKHEIFCKQNNQLPTKSHVEWKDNSNGDDPIPTWNMVVLKRFQSQERINFSPLFGTLLYVVMSNHFDCKLSNFDRFVSLPQSAHLF